MWKFSLQYSVQYVPIIMSTYYVVHIQEDNILLPFLPFVCPCVMVAYFDFACVHLKKLLKEIDGQNIPLLYTIFFIILLVDVNECLKTPNICGGYGTCRNTYRSRECDCHNGYEGLPCKGIVSCLRL